MKRAAFRLQPVLELRRTEERAAAAAAAEAARAAAEADRRATGYEESLASAVLPRSLPAGQFLAAMTMLRTAATDASDARAVATATAEQAELVRARWTAAAGRTKGIERLRERHLAAHERAQEAAEERVVDDLVTGRARRFGSRAADDCGEDRAPGDGAQGHETREAPWTE